MRRRGFTLVEMCLVMALTALILGAVAGLYTFSMTRVGTAMASASSQQQAKAVMDEISKTIAMSVTCVVVSYGGNPALRCILPSTTTDTNGDGYPDSATPSAVSRRGEEKWGEGTLVYYYLSDVTGNPATAGSIVWRAKRTDYSTPTSADADSKWSLYTGTTARYPLITNLTFTVITSTHMVVVAVQSGALRRADRSPSGTEPSALLSNISLARTIYWRNWRP